MNNDQKIVNGLLWKLLERFGVQGAQFVLQIILARILDPEHYGVLSMMIIFTALANVFIQRGFNTALIQNKDVTEKDYSSVFWVTGAVAIILYIVLFAAAPFIAQFYNMPDLVQPFRVLCLVLFPGALNSIQLAKVSRALDFKKVFYSNVAAIVVAGALGIVLAICGAGLWALVAQNLVNVSVACIVMWFTVKWRPTFKINFQRIKVLFSYGWKLLVSGLMDTLYQDLRSLIIGKKFDSATLGYYNRGKQFPHFIINSINAAVQSVMLPAMSANQDDRGKLKILMRNSITISSFIIFPMMAGLAGVAKPLVSLLLTEKWLPCVPYLQIYCFTMAFLPVHTCNLQAINAMGRSDIFLRLEVIKKIYGTAVLILAVIFFESPIGIALTGIISSLISCFVNISPNKKLVGYSYIEQMKDIVPYFITSLLMCGCVLAVGMLQLPDILLLILQFITGVVVYTAMSYALRLPACKTVHDLLRRNLKKKRSKYTA